MKKQFSKLSAFAALCLCSQAVLAQNTTNDINTITTAVPFLRINPDARTTGMGETGIATAPDAFSSFLNNGKTVFNTKKAGIGVTYTPWLKDLNLDDVFLASLGAYYKLDDAQAVNFGLRYFSLGSIQFTNSNGENLSTGKPREFAVDLGYSRKLSDRSGLGLNVRYISSDLTNGYTGGNYKKGSTVAADLHFFRGTADANGAGFAWGATLSNLGGKISYTNDANAKDFIPANLGLGASYTVAPNEDNKVTFALDVNKLLVPTVSDTSANGLTNYRQKGVVSSWFSSFGDAPGGGGEEFKEFTFGVGAEYWYKNQFSFRAGYFYENPDKGNRRYITVGAGLKYNMFGLNFGYIVPSGSGISRNPLSNTMRFSVLFDLDGTGSTVK